MTVARSGTAQPHALFHAEVLLEALHHAMDIAMRQLLQAVHGCRHRP